MSNYLSAIDLSAFMTLFPFRRELASATYSQLSPTYCQFASRVIQSVDIFDSTLVMHEQHELHSVDDDHASRHVVVVERHVVDPKNRVGDGEVGTRDEEQRSGVTSHAKPAVESGASHTHQRPSSTRTGRSLLFRSHRPTVRRASRPTTTTTTTTLTTAVRCCINNTAITVQQTGRRQERYYAETRRPPRLLVQGIRSRRARTTSMDTVKAAMHEITLPSYVKA
ncbi:hypothetical protein DBV15_07502 [Temnothorax longispinosus]|uniref:Uncharacterized protein n=1 Tax=Temnothorax longispinosus TaxID=300112 RepID=A0A4S2JRE1_9HYME|nr:hypothetical protein DBV15_07502 [Temnothorax longispinosus]